LITHSSVQIANALLGINAVSINFNKPFLYTFVSGIKGPMYCDNRRLLSHPKKRRMLVNEFVKVAKKLKFDVVGGVSTGGIPWAALVAEKLNKPMIYIRPEPKEYGRKRQIEGDFKKGSKILLIEDLIGTGSSAISAIRAIRKNNGSVSDCIFIFTYEFDISKKNFSKIKCKMHPLLTFSDLVQIATKQGYLKKNESIKLIKWNEDPKHYKN
jgi:orotate phosphoribosyltransferase